MNVLAGIEDPELKKPLTELDMVKSITIEGSDVTVEINLTTPDCPMKAKIREDITAGVSAIDGVTSVRVKFDAMSDEELERLKQKLGHGRRPETDQPPKLTYAKRFIAVASGKGGVGKSTITANIAVAMARLGRKVGVLDADLYGFSLPRMLGVDGQPTVIDDKIIPLRKGDNIQIVSMGFFINEDEPVVWRGPLLHKAIKQFLADVMWDELDYLFMDLPPGTGDVTITIAQTVPSAELLVVTTPQATATHVAGRVAKVADKTNLTVVGVIENMAYFEVNGQREYIFGKDGGKDLARRLNVPLLGEIPLATAIREGADIGKPVASEGTEDQISLFENIARRLDQRDQR
ncbi:MAG: Mrp/NBP35 family ATP-binding protein [candidate division Zixibacteria bacterium]|nr:Mrp/NBP35 family ATP-binding protein [candidate division Zixibacteria bacterium]